MKFSYSENFLNKFFHYFNQFAIHTIATTLKSMPNCMKSIKWLQKSCLSKVIYHVAIRMSYCSMIYCRDIATFDIALLQCERSSTTESVLFISDILLYCFVIWQQVILLQCESVLIHGWWLFIPVLACQTSCLSHSYGAIYPSLCGI